MSRYWFGGDLATWVFQSVDTTLSGIAKKVPTCISQALWFYDAPAGGNRHTDCLDAGGLAISQVMTDSVGFGPRFQLPDEVSWAWLDANSGNGPRRRIQADSARASTAASILAALTPKNYLPEEMYGANGGVATLGSTGINQQDPKAHGHSYLTRVLKPDATAVTFRSDVQFAGPVQIVDDSVNGRTVVTVLQSVVNDLKVAADVTQNSTTNPTNTKLNITGLSQVCAVGDEWVIDGPLFFDGDPTADVALDLTCPAGTLAVSWMGLGTGAANGAGATNFQVTTTSGTGANFGLFTPALICVRVYAVFICTAAGTLQFRWSQNVSGTGNITLKGGISRLTAAKVVG